MWGLHGIVHIVSWIVLRDEEVCAYSHNIALCNYSFLVRLHVPSKSPILYVVQVYL